MRGRGGDGRRFHGRGGVELVCTGVGSRVIASASVMLHIGFRFSEKNNNKRIVRSLSLKLVVQSGGGSMFEHIFMLVKIHQARVYIGTLLPDLPPRKEAHTL